MYIMILEILIKGVCILENNNFNNFDPLGQNQNKYQQPMQSYSPQSGFSSNKPPKKKKGFGIGALISCCLICSILASAITTGTIYYYSKTNNNGIINNSTTNITVDKQSTNLVSAIAQKAVPSVVGIGVTASVSTFFGFSTDTSNEGSGVIYSDDGYIITNYHVVSMAIESDVAQSAQISVFLSTDTETAIPASVVGYNSDYDLAVLKINKTGLSAIEFADSNTVAVGDVAVAIGSPGGRQFISSVSSGIISGLNRTIQLEGTAQMKLLQTDAAINPGNSGGALVDCYGKLIGINSSKISSEEYEGMGFAIPSNTVKKIVSNIINNKDKKFAYVGVKVSTEYTAQDLISMGYPAGAVVEEVTSGSPADELGIRSADIIVEFNGVKIKDYEDYNTERIKCKPGDTVSITIYRNGRNYDAQLTLGESNN